jgi:hypothetical protein
MRLAQKCLRDNVNNIKSKSWENERFKVRLDYIVPVQVGEWKEIEFVVLNYYPNQLRPQQPAVVVDLTNEAN